MGLSDLVRTAVKIANDATADLQPTVTLRRWIGQTGKGTPKYDDPETFGAVVDQRITHHHTKSGEVIVTKAYVLILQPIAPNGAATRLEPIDPRDHLTLPDGTTGPIVDGSGFIDRKTAHPYLSEIWIGS